jgi:hypothetical protein
VGKWQPQKKANCLHSPEDIRDVLSDKLVVTVCLSKIVPLVFRGDVQDFGVKCTSGRTQGDGSGSVLHRSMSDILIGYSTLPGFMSHRDKYLGTWYIQAVCEVFMEHACDTDVEDMLKMVSLSLLSVLLSLFHWFDPLREILL